MKEQRHLRIHGKVQGVGYRFFATRVARRMGLNTIETYVAWNAHAPEPGTFDLTGGLDLDRFLRMVADAGMYAIVRPGPYICA